MRVMALLWRFLGPDRWRFALGLALTFLEGIVAAVPALLVGVAVAAMGGGGMSDTELALVAAGVPAAFALRLALLLAARTGAFPAGVLASERLRLALLDHMRRVPLATARRWRPSRLGTLVSDDAHWVGEAGRMTLFLLLAGLGAAVALLVVTVAAAPAIGLPVVAAIGLGLLAFARGDRVVRGVARTRTGALAEATARVGEYADGIPVFRSFGRTGFALVSLEGAVSTMRDLGTRSLAPFAFAMQAGRIIVDLGLLAALGLVALCAADGVELGPLAFATLLAFVATELFVGTLAGQLVRYRMAERAEREVGRFLDEPVPVPATAAVPTSFDIAFDHVSFAYSTDRNPALDDVSFSLPAGSVTAIVGPSGAGKSTIASLLAREDDPSAGTIRLGGIDLRDMDPAVLGRVVSVVSQDVFLFRDTLRANLLLGDPLADERRLAAAVAAARLQELVAALPEGLDTPLGDGGRTLSGGERQRVAIARAILKDAPILVLDEATSAIDPVTERALQAGISTLERGRTLLVIAHRLRTIRHADTILVLAGGRIVERGQHTDLLAAGGVYNRLWRAQERSSSWTLRPPPAPRPE